MREPPDKGGGTVKDWKMRRWNIKKTAEEMTEELNAAAELINQIQCKQNQCVIGETTVKELKLKLFIIENTVSDLNDKLVKMAPKPNANDTAPINVNNVSDNNEEPITPGRKMRELKCSEEGCSFTCVRKDKMKRHVDGEHGSSSMNSTMTTDFKNLSPSSCSTQASYMATPTPNNNKRKLEDDDEGEELEPEKSKKKIDPNETTVDESELSKAAEEAELEHKALEDAKLIEMIKKKHAEDSKKREADTKASIEAAADAVKAAEGTSIVLTGKVEDRQALKNPFVDTVDSQTGEGDDQESFSLLQNNDQDDKKLGELIPEDDDADELYVTLTGGESSTGVGGVTADQELIKQVEDLEAMLVESKSDNKEKANTIAIMMIKMEKLQEKLEDSKKENSYLRGLVRDHKANIQSLQRQNKEWKMMGEEYLLKEDKDEKEEISKLKKKVAELTKKCGDMTKQISTIEKEKDTVAHLSM